MTLDSVNGYHTKRAQSFWKGAVVGTLDGRFVLERPGKKPVDLGGTEKEVHLALTGLARADREARALELPPVDI
jgi:hypothetical protein